VAESKIKCLFNVFRTHVHVREVLCGVLYLEAHNNRFQKKKKKETRGRGWGHGLGSSIHTDLLSGDQSPRRLFV